MKLVESQDGRTAYWMPAFAGMTLLFATCGMPECGLSLIVTKSVAVCRDNICVVMSLTEDHRERDAGVE